VSGTAAECVAVCEIDHRIIGAGKMGPVTRALQQAFQSAIRGQHPRSAEWLDYVNVAAPVSIPVHELASA
jgi:branched-chain amino acid aminotransferase